MKNLLLFIYKYAALFLIGGAVYCLLELIFRSRTHWTMGIVGGLCFIFCGLINELFDYEMLVWHQMGICAIGITLIEFISGCILNLWLKLGIWDYSNMPLNICGQICLPFTILWFFLSLGAIVLDDWLRYWLFKEERPHYRFT